MRLGVVPVALLALTACGNRLPAPPPVPVQTGPIGTADTCGATPYLYLIGEQATALERVLILRQVRVNWPEDELDGTSKLERLNFNIGVTGRVETITCG